MNTTPKDQGLWNALAMFAFLAVFVAAFDWALGGFGRHAQALYGITAFDLSLMALATFRLIRLVTYDKIFAFVRDAFMDERDGALVKPKGGFRRLIAELIECMWCTGLWAALFVGVVYLVSPLGFFFVLILAIAALGSFLQNVSKAVATYIEK